MAAHNASSLNICTSATLKEKVYATRYQRYHTSHPQTLHPILSLFGITKKLIAQSYKLKDNFNVKINIKTHCVIKSSSLL